MLNQTQRDHAIKMIEEKAAEKANTFRKPYPNPTEFALAYFKSKGITSVKLADILKPKDTPVEPEKHWQSKGIYYSRESHLQFDFFTLVDCGAAYNKACNAIDQEFERVTRNLYTLLASLKTRIMFGTDASEIEEALRLLDDYKGG